MTLLRRLFGWSSHPVRGDLLRKSEATTSEAQAIQAAQQAVRAKGLSWTDPILAEYRFSPEGPYWLIQTNWTARGHTVFITVNDNTGIVSRIQSRGRTGLKDHGG